MPADTFENVSHEFHKEVQLMHLAANTGAVVALKGAFVDEEAKEFGIVMEKCTTDLAAYIRCAGVLFVLTCWHHQSVLYGLQLH